MPYGARHNDPYLALCFRVDIVRSGERDPQPIGAFSEVTGLQVEVELHDYREGGANDTMLRFIGPVKYPSHLILKRGVVDAQILWQWQSDVMNGTIQPFNATIIMLDSTGQMGPSWTFQGVCPVRWSGPNLRAGSAEVALETLELTHRGLVLG
jgi:phage tail-like protein